MKALVPCAALLLVACSQPAPRQAGVEDAWVRLPAVPGRPGAAYFTLTGGSTPLRLEAVDSERVATIELHETGQEGGRMTMRRLDGVDVPPRAPVSFRTGSRHAMLFGIRPEVKRGDLMPLGFRFADGTRIVASARVLGAADPPPGE